MNEYHQAATLSWSGMLDRAIRAAWRMMVLRLFRPFSSAYWFTLGFAAWLAALSEGGASGLFNLLNLMVRPSLPSPGETGAVPDVQEVLAKWQGLLHWMQIHVVWVVFAAVLLMILLLVVWLLLLWLGARGRFMFLEGVTTGAVSVVESWKRWRDPANAAFVWLLLFRLVRGLVGAVVLAGAAGLLFMASFRKAGLPGSIVLVSLVVGAPFLVLLAVSHFFEAFVLPLMFRYRIRAGAAWRVFLDILRPNWPGFLLYLAVLFFLRLIAAIAVLLVILGTCCAAGIVLALPYLGAVLLLPVTVYFRLLSLYFLQQFHGDFRFVPFPEELPGGGRLRST